MFHPDLFLETQVYLYDERPTMAPGFITIFEEHSIVTKSFTGSLLYFKRLAKQGTCPTVCTYIMENYMAITEHLDDDTKLWNEEPNTYQSDDQYSDDNDDNRSDYSPQVQTCQIRIQEKAHLRQTRSLSSTLMRTNQIKPQENFHESTTIVQKIIQDMKK